MCGFRAKPVCVKVLKQNLEKHSGKFAWLGGLIQTLLGGAATAGSPLLNLWGWAV